MCLCLSYTVVWCGVVVVGGWRGVLIEPGDTIVLGWHCMAFVLSDTQDWLLDVKINQWKSFILTLVFLLSSPPRCDGAFHGWTDTHTVSEGTIGSINGVTLCSLALRVDVLFLIIGSFVSSDRIKDWVDQMQRELVTLADTASAGKSLTQVPSHFHFSLVYIVLSFFPFFFFPLFLCAFSFNGRSRECFAVKKVTNQCFVLPHLFCPCLQIFLANQNLYTVEQNDAEELVARAARNIEQLLRKRSAALEVRTPVPSKSIFNNAMVPRVCHYTRYGVLWSHGHVKVLLRTMLMLTQMATNLWSFC